jgi:cytochrome c oxidase assembly factor CtaG
MGHVAQIAPHLSVIHLWSVVHDNCEAFAKAFMDIVETFPTDAEKQATAEKWLRAKAIERVEREAERAWAARREIRARVAQVKQRRAFR